MANSVLLQSNALHIPLPDQSVQCVVTSPPYYGLRDYGTSQQVWASEHPLCADGRHSWVDSTFRRKNSDTKKGQKQNTNVGANNRDKPCVNSFCDSCGAWFGELGLEPSLDLYIKHLTDVFREIWRVLRDDGTCWLNLGDSYNGNGTGQKTWGLKSGHDTFIAQTTGQIARRVDGLKPKDLIGIPWRVAFALQADGWYLRSDIVWHKPNPMPESVVDRPTKAHEYIFLLSKRERYYYDSETIAELSVHPDDNRKARATESQKRYPDALTAGVRCGSATYPTRNRRTVWTVATAPYKGAHFATYPPKLIEPCILAGSRAGDVVLDPFCGSGTTGAVALQHGRSFVGLDLNPAYIKLAAERIACPARAPKRKAVAKKGQLPLPF